MAYLCTETKAALAMFFVKLASLYIPRQCIVCHYLQHACTLATFLLQLIVMAINIKTSFVSLSRS